MPFHRRRFDRPADGSVRGDARLGRAPGLLTEGGRAGGRPRGIGLVAVVTIAKIYGSSFGLPHPGLLPTKDELAERQRWVEAAISSFAPRRRGGRSGGGDAQGGKKLTAVARARGARTIVIDETP